MNKAIHQNRFSAGLLYVDLLLAGLLLRSGKRPSSRKRSMSAFLSLACLLALASPAAFAQTVPVEGMQDNTPTVHAFVNATIVPAPGTVWRDATLVIRDGVIEAAGRRVQPPADARIHNLQGKTIYAGFIDAHTTAGMGNVRTDSDRGHAYWNPQVRAHFNAASEYEADSDDHHKLRKQGFTAALTAPGAGIFKGEAAVLSLSDQPVSERLIRNHVAQAISLTRTQGLGSGYPTSTIGSIAVIRQTLYDADWHERVHQAWKSQPAGHQRPETIAPLQALEPAARGAQPLLFNTANDEEILRVMRLAEEFSITPWIVGSGHEYKIMDVLPALQAPLIIPVNFPEAPDVSTPEDALSQSLAALHHWYLAPENPARLERAGISFSLTTHGLNEVSDFLPSLRRAVQGGLSAEGALAALTTRPAELLGIAQTHGSIEPGKSAHFIIASDDLFEKQGRILEVWVDGVRHTVHTEPVLNPTGTWALENADRSVNAILTLEQNRPKRYSGTLTIDEVEIAIDRVTLGQSPGRLRIDFAAEALGMDGTIRLTAALSEDRMHGWADIPGREQLQWHGERTRAAGQTEAREPAAPRPRDLSLPVRRPFTDYGFESVPEQHRHVLIRNATIWTMGPQGVLEQADMLVTDGKVAEVGSGLRAPRNATVIDAAGRHVTPGLIDPHIHSGVTGVNEVGNAIVPEVRMEDVVTINNPWMYRQLAGGLTTAHVMHGSANPIGGQNVFKKMKWGSLPDELVMQNVPRTVKFALGENPKRVGTNRYPETRMGVEQIIADRFRMARDYQARWKRWEQTGEGLPPRRDLRLEAVLDILNGDINIEAHNYRNDEILMLIRLADEFGITVNNFHHSVEAYKVAPEIAEHGAGAVVWTDWSSFKIEAYDATVYNARLLHETGVKTSLHSDNSQIASRMNWEAAKMVRAGMDPVDALSLVTSSAAHVMGIDHRVGSLEPGKDGDFVIWSGDPLSTFTRAEQTWIEGRRYFDLEEDARLREQMQTERSLLIERILEKIND